MTIIDSQAKRDHEFESAFLQRGVRNEPCGYQAAPCRRRRAVAGTAPRYHRRGGMIF